MTLIVRLVNHVCHVFVDFAIFFLAQTQRLLRLFALGDITCCHYASKQAIATVDQWRQPQFNPSLRFALTQNDFILRLEHIFISRNQRRPCVKQVFCSLTNRLRSRYTERILQGRVDIDNVSLRVQHDHSVWHFLNHKVTPHRRKEKVNQFQSKYAKSEYNNTNRKSKRRYIQMRDGR